MGAFVYLRTSVCAIKRMNCQDVAGGVDLSHPNVEGCLLRLIQLCRMDARPRMTAHSSSFYYDLRLTSRAGMAFTVVSLALRCVTILCSAAVGRHPSVCGLQ